MDKFMGFGVIPILQHRHIVLLLWLLVFGYLLVTPWPRGSTRLVSSKSMMAKLLGKQVYVSEGPAAKKPTKKAAGGTLDKRTKVKIRRVDGRAERKRQGMSSNEDGHIIKKTKPNGNEAKLVKDRARRIARKLRKAILCKVEDVPRKPQKVMENHPNRGRRRRIR